MTSSPSPIPNARKAMTKASVPEFKPTACFTPICSAQSFSNSATSSPRMKLPVSITLLIASSTSERIDAVCSWRSIGGIIFFSGMFSILILFALFIA